MSGKLVYLPGFLAYCYADNYEEHIQEHCIKKAQIASMEEFIDNVKILINTLGYKVLVPVPKATDDTIYLFCKGYGASSEGFVSVGGFTVLKGSTVSDYIVPSLETRGKTYYSFRNALVKEGIIADQASTRDYEFNAPSATSAVVLPFWLVGNIGSIIMRMC